MLVSKSAQKPSCYSVEQCAPNVDSVQWLKATPLEFILFVWRYSGGAEYFSVWRNNGSWLRVLGATMKRWRPIDQRVLPTREGVSPPLWTTHSLNRSWTRSVGQTSEPVSLPVAWMGHDRKEVFMKNKNPLNPLVTVIAFLTYNTARRVTRSCRNWITALVLLNHPAWYPQFWQCRLVFRRKPPHTTVAWTTPILVLLTRAWCYWSRQVRWAPSTVINDQAKHRFSSISQVTFLS